MAGALVLSAECHLQIAASWTTVKLFLPVRGLLVYEKQSANNGVHLYMPHSVVTITVMANQSHGASSMAYSGSRSPFRNLFNDEK